MKCAVFSRRRNTVLAALALLALALPDMSVPNAAAAEENDAAMFMERFSGEWRGTGKLLVGPETGLKFHCALDGDPSRTELTFGMTGKCWAGRLSGRVYARLRYNGDTNRFYGDFLDGAEANGVDVIGERRGDGFSLLLSRGMAHGELIAKPAGRNKMTVTILLSDKTRTRSLPVAAMGFARKGEKHLPAYDPVVTGSLKRN
ncbi:MAG TPA: hypothetical protein VLA28_12230 [Afifellaceae bacterium]|nr:hypothetical protein [Afifellaceae bacterium]